MQSPPVFEVESISHKEMRKFVINMEDALAMADIREAYCKSHKPCPRCNDVQVQLVSSPLTHGEWKCRRCSHKWQTVLDLTEILDNREA